MRNQDPVALLARWLSVRGRAAELASDIGVQESTVSRWRRRISKPSVAARECIERRTGIPRQLWEKAP